MNPLKQSPLVLWVSCAPRSPLRPRGRLSDPTVPAGPAGRAGPATRSPQEGPALVPRCITHSVSCRSPRPSTLGKEREDRPPCSFCPQISSVWADDPAAVVLKLAGLWNHLSWAQGRAHTTQGDSLQGAPHSYQMGARSGMGVCQQLRPENGPARGTGCRTGSPTQASSVRHMGFGSS